MLFFTASVSDSDDLPDYAMLSNNLVEQPLARRRMAFVNTDGLISLLIIQGKAQSLGWRTIYLNTVVRRLSENSSGILFHYVANLRSAWTTPRGTVIQHASRFCTALSLSHYAC